jgi:hypothetical protein
MGVAESVIVRWDPDHYPEGFLPAPSPERPPGIRWIYSSTPICATQLAKRRVASPNSRGNRTQEGEGRKMNEAVTTHYRGGGSLATKIASDLRDAGIELENLSASDLESIDEFHFRGRGATMELLGKLQLRPASIVLDIGSGLATVFLRRPDRSISVEICRARLRS